ncbi:MAG: hypothetical protein SOY99_02685 [Alloprevotella sp.]|nr:hypothetical protein [Alloprevotella sp.]
MRVKTYILTLSLLFIPFFLCRAQAPLPKNEIKIGKCAIRGNVSNQMPHPLEVCIYWNDFYTEIPRVQKVKINENGEISDELLLTTKYSFVAIAVETEKAAKQFLRLVSQDDTLVINITDSIQITGDISTSLVFNDILTNYLISMDQESSFTDIKRGHSAMQHKEYVDTVIYPQFMRAGEQLLSPNINAGDKAFLENWAMLTFYPKTLLYAVRDSSNVPSNYFNFLNKLSLDQQLLYNNYGLRFFLDWLLYSPSLMIPSIKDTSIQKWKNTISEKLSTIPFSPTEFFSNLITFHCYMNLLEKEKTLTKQQKENIAKDLSKEWKELLYRYESKFKTSQTSKMFEDIESQLYVSFESILNESKGVPIIVDFWFTSCAPCIGVRNTIESILSDPKYEKVQIVSITSPSISPIEEWRKLVDSRAGLHYMISDSLMQKVMSDYDFNGYPALLFYDKNHSLIQSKEGLLSEREIKDILCKILP